MFKDNRVWICVEAICCRGFFYWLFMDAFFMFSLACIVNGKYMVRDVTPYRVLRSRDVLEIKYNFSRYLIVFTLHHKLIVSKSKLIEHYLVIDKMNFAHHYWSSL